MNFLTDVKKQVVEEIHKPARINFKRRRVIIESLNDLIQADLVDMKEYSREDKGYKYILVAINCFSKSAWALPLKTKTGPEVTSAMEEILKKISPKNLQTDAGLEFFNQHFQKLMKKYNVNHYNVFSDKKASIVERVNRIMMWKEFNFLGHYKWVAILPKIVKLYKQQTRSIEPFA